MQTIIGGRSDPRSHLAVPCDGLPSTCSDAKGQKSVVEPLFTRNPQPMLVLCEMVGEFRDNETGTFYVHQLPHVHGSLATGAWPDRRLHVTGRLSCSIFASTVSTGLKGRPSCGRPPSRRLPCQPEFMCCYQRRGPRWIKAHLPERPHCNSSVRFPRAVAKRATGGGQRTNKYGT